MKKIHNHYAAPSVEASLLSVSAIDENESRHLGKTYVPKKGGKSNEKVDIRYGVS